METFCEIIGITGGKPHHNTEGGVNTLCLPHNPEVAPPHFPRNPNSDYVAQPHGSEYEFSYGNVFKNDDVSCAVCHVTVATSVVIIPAKSSCPRDWNMQYKGYLVTNADVSDWHAFDFVCLHHDAEYLTEGA